MAKQLVFRQVFDTGATEIQETKENVDKKVSKDGIALGIQDGLLHLFIDGEVVGTGVALPSGASGDVVGNVDSDNTIVLNGALADGTYTIKYKMEDGSVVDIGPLDTNVYYSVTINRTNCTINNSATQVVKGQSYSATITANSGYTLKSVTVTMGGANVSVTNGIINIASVTGDIVITAVAEKAAVEPVNQIPISITSSKTLFVGTNGEKGYKTNTRLSSSSGAESTSSASGKEVTGFIPVTYGCTVYLKGITVTTSTSEVIGFYNASFTKLACGYTNTAFGTTDGAVVSAKINGNTINDANVTSAVAYMRISAAEINANSIITVDQPIT